jgi:hypothetical protein
MESSACRAAAEDPKMRRESQRRLDIDVNPQPVVFCVHAQLAPCRAEVPWGSKGRFAMSHPNGAQTDVRVASGHGGHEVSSGHQGERFGPRQDKTRRAVPDRDFAHDIGRFEHCATASVRPVQRRKDPRAHEALASSLGQPWSGPVRGVHVERDRAVPRRARATNPLARLRSSVPLSSCALAKHDEPEPCERPERRRAVRPTAHGSASAS